MIVNYIHYRYLPPIKEKSLLDYGPKLLHSGEDLTIVSCGYSTLLSQQVVDAMLKEGIKIDLIDMRILNPMNPELIIKSVQKTKKILVVDGGWKSCGITEILATLYENIDVGILSEKPVRITLPFNSCTFFKNIRKTLLL